MSSDSVFRFGASLVLVAILIFAPSSLVAQPSDDVEGAEDQPLISRYEGFVILGYKHTDYDRQLLPAGLEGGEISDTDHRGSMEHNMALSQRRAEAVVDDLASEHGIARSRLEAHGVGPLAPVAPNETSDGRARNRRVELVKQP